MEAHGSTLGRIANGSVALISAELLLQQMRSGVPILVIDVRDRPELVETGAIAGARSFPLHQLRSRIAELTEQQRMSVVVVSQTESRSRTAAVTLSVAGFNDVAVLEGGMKRWMELGYPVELRGPDSVRFVPISLR